MLYSRKLSACFKKKFFNIDFFPRVHFLAFSNHSAVIGFPSKMVGTRVLVYGGNGALGNVCVSSFKTKNVVRYGASRKYFNLNRFQFARAAASVIFSVVSCSYLDQPLAII